MRKSRPESLRSSGSSEKDDGEGALLLRARGDCAPCTGGLRHREERMQSRRGRRRPCLPGKALPAPGTRDERNPEGGSAQEPQEGRVCAQACSSKTCPIQRHKRRRESPSPATRCSLPSCCRSRTYRGIFAPRRRWRRRPRPCSSETIGTRFQGPGKKAKDRPDAPDSTAPRTTAPAGKRLSLP